MEEMKEEEARHIKDELSEEKLEIFDLPSKEKLFKYEEKKVKHAAKKLHETSITKKSELFFVVGWQDDPQSTEIVKCEILDVLNCFLPESYKRDVFTQKSNLIYEHKVDQAEMGFNWVT